MTKMSSAYCFNFHVEVSFLFTYYAPVFFAFVQEYIDAHPETVILDPLPAIRTLLDRFKSYKLIHKLEESMKGMYLRS